tara:strand:- start:1733 stop:2047 length:315 start_codon:yes stop_codon:yes gene_type:complete
MPKGVIYKTREAAQVYADEQAGAVIEVDEDGDGVMDGFSVVTDSEDRTTGANPSDVPKADREAHEEYLRKVAGAGGRSIPTQIVGARSTWAGIWAASLKTNLAI